MSQPINPPVNPPINPDDEFEPRTDIIEEPLEEDQTVVVTEEIVETEAPLETAPAVVGVKREAQGGILARPELVALALSGLVLLLVIGFYFLVLAPAQSDLKNRKAQRDDQEKKLDDLKGRFGNSTRTEEIVANLERSVDDFESRYLPIASIGRTGLYDRINGLMYAYHLRNTAGPDYSPMDISVQRGDQPQEERGKAKFQSLFPGVYISMTVEGSYANLRRFIGEIEASPQFVVISTVALEAAENTQQETTVATGPPIAAGRTGTLSGKADFGQPPPPVQQTGRAAAPKGKTHGETVSLHMELAAYFHREGPMQPADAPR